MFELELQLASAWPDRQWCDVSVVVAVSGGADSVALAQALARAKTSGRGRLWIAHFNHALRGDESAADEHFVNELAAKLGLGCRVGHAAPGALASAGADGVEAAARQARYAFLQATAEEVGARYVATAHTADDQVETIVQRIFRGTGISGLAGMARARQLGPAATLIRPVLGVRREMIRQYLAELGQAWRDDSTNSSSEPTRNWIRHELLPLVNQKFPSAADAVLRLSTLAGEAREALETAAAALAERAVSVSEGTITCDCQRLAGAHRYVLREMFVQAWRDQGWPEQGMGFAEWEALANLALAAPQSAGGASQQRDFPGAVRAQKTGARLSLARL